MGRLIIAQIRKVIWIKFFLIQQWQFLAKAKQQQQNQNLVGDIAEVILPSTCKSKSAVAIKQQTNPLFADWGKKIKIERMFKGRLGVNKQSQTQLEPTEEKFGEHQKQFGEQAKKQNKYKKFSYLSSIIQTQHVMIKKYQRLWLNGQQTGLKYQQFEEIQKQPKAINQKLQTNYIQGNKARFKNRSITQKFSRANSKFRASDHDDFQALNTQSNMSSFYTRAMSDSSQILKKFSICCRLKKLITKMSKLHTLKCENQSGWPSKFSTMVERKKQSKCTASKRYATSSYRALAISLQILLKTKECR